MVDNVAITAGTGTTVATDDVSGVHYQKVKVALGAADAATLASSGAGATDAGTLRVVLSDDQISDIGQTDLANSISVAPATDYYPPGTYSDDVGFTVGGKVNSIGARFDNTSPDSIDEDDIGILRMSANRNLYVQLRDSAGNERGLNVDSTNALGVSGAVAHDSATSSSPVVTGFKATAALSGATMVTAGDATYSFAGLDGVQITRPHCNLEDIVTGNASNTDGTSTEVVAAQAAGIKTYLTSIILTNTSATMIYVEIKDGATAKIVLPVPATSGVIFNPPVPLGGTAATAWNFDASAATTTLYCSVIGFKSKL
jgi:hypothetical protein